MTRNERQALIGKLLEYAQAYGWYLAQSEAYPTLDKEDLRKMANTMGIIEEVLDVVGVKYGVEKKVAIEEGKELWRYNKVLHCDN